MQAVHQLFFGGYAMMKILLLSGVAALSAVVSISVANATVLAVIGQVSDTDQVTATVAGSVTTISSSTLVDITAIDAPISVPITATLAFTASSVGPAIIVSGNIVEAFSGSFSITGGGNNYLSGTFDDSVFGGGSSLTLTASNDQPGETVTFTSSVIPVIDLADNRGVSFSFTDVSPPASTVGSGASRTLAPFAADISGDFSATVPEPATWAMLGLGFAGMGLLGLIRRKGSRYAF
jgi:PEP-CTERM motif